MKLNVTGTFTGDGTNSQAFDLGFRPSKVEIYNVTDGDVKHEVVDDGADGVHFKIDAAVAKVSSDAAQITSRGFLTGTDATILESAKAYRFIAWR